MSPLPKALERLRQKNEWALELAKRAALAAWVEPELLRALRLETLTGASAAAEADLWFSELVLAHSSSALVLRTEHLEPLREELRREQGTLQRAIEVIRRMHANSSELLQREERIIAGWLTDTLSLPEIQEQLLEVLSTLIDEPSPARRDAIASWALGAWPRLPGRVRYSSAALQLVVAANQRRGGYLASPSIELVDETFDGFYMGLVGTQSRPAHVEVAWAGDEFFLKQVQSRGEVTVEVPETVPIVLEVDSAQRRRLVLLRPNEPARTTVEGDELTLRTMDGRSYRIAQAQDKPAPETPEWLESRASTSPFSWIHLSDLHIGTPIKDQRRMLDELRRDIAQMLESGVPRPDAIFVTGDIAFSGASLHKDEYTQAARWLADIAKSAGLGLDAVFVVPGNHDIQRSADKPGTTVALVRALREGKVSLDEALTDLTARAQLSARLENYLRFAANFAPMNRRDAEAPGAQLHWRHILRMRGRWRVRIVGLNTALLSDDNDHGRLRLGTRQLTTAFTEPDVGPDEVVIVLSHHPLQGGWLQDEAEATSWIHRHAHLHLSSHVHDRAISVRVSRNDDTHLASLTAGAYHEKTSHEGVLQYGYSLGTLMPSKDVLRLTAWPRTWSNVQGNFTSDSSNTHIGWTNTEFDLPRTRAVDVVIVPAFQPELPAVLEALNISNVKQEKTEQGRVYFHGSLRSQLEERDYRLVVTSVGYADKDAASAAIQELIATHQPRVLLLMGIGIVERGKFRIGEVLLSERGVTHEPAAVESYKPPHPVTQSLVTYRTEPTRLDAEFRRIGGTYPAALAGDDAQKFQSHVASSITVRTGKLGPNRAQVAYRMPALDVFSAFQSANIPYLLIEGISGFGDYSREEEFQTFASRAALAVLVDFLTHGLAIPIEVPAQHYPATAGLPGAVPGSFWLETRRLTGGARNQLDLSMRGRQSETGSVHLFGVDPARQEERTLTLRYNGIDYAGNTIKFPMTREGRTNGTWRLQMNGRSSTGQKFTAITGHSFQDSILVFRPLGPDHFEVTRLDATLLDQVIRASRSSDRNPGPGRHFGIF